MATLIIISIIVSIFSTCLFWNCLKLVNKNKSKLNIYLTVIFFIIYFVLFYIVQTSSPKEIKNWYIIDSLMSKISGVGFLALLYNIFQKLKHILKK
ncbi:multisubunit Na+/H+ antiporter MnhB subunit [Alkaliphilus hydrothermalis]|uniref:Multisubunit Na+/H+ antiporter MnhB subunit n=1 Tax=Alkaliphilus hydrothermalis TaxID=1482730 RepID=A0ABS2NQ29_9FIRM|nr:multisubunit Na+/H+ antiporter MnhB subunit [Alkaliphilus hydrothermalis]